MSGTAATQLRARAEALAAPLPPLLAQAEHLASAMLMGGHGRRRAGTGSEFWQFRPAVQGDGQRQIDWRRSGRGDAHFVRQQEWQAAQSVYLWADRSASMRLETGREPPKADRARLLALALAIVLGRAEERVGLLDGSLPPAAGRAQATRLALALAGDDGAEYGTPPGATPVRGARVVMLSDFLGPIEPLAAALARMADRAVSGALVQILSPEELRFPFDGRTIFQSATGGVEFETRRARGLRAAYLARLAERQAELSALSRRLGWRFTVHATDSSAQAGLAWLFHAIEKAR